MKKINKKDLIFFIITIVIAIITYNKFISIHYSTDMYNIINKGYINYIISNSLTDGRLFVSIYLFIGNLLKIKPEIYKCAITIIAIIINAISVIKLKNIILKIKPAKNLYIETIIYIIAYCIIFNFIEVELLYYIESAAMNMSILLIILAIDIFIKREKYYYFKTTFLCILSVICYQATIPLFIALIITFSLIKNKNNYKEILKDLLKGISIMLLAVFTNILIVKITTSILNTSQNRISFNIKIMWENFKYITNNIFWIFINQCNIYVEKMFLSFIIILCILAVYESLKQKENHTLNILLIVFITIITNFAMHIPSLSAYYTARTKYAVGAIIGLIFMYMYTNTKIYDKENFKSNFIVILLIMYLSSNIVVGISITSYHKEVNKLEKEETYQIKEYIENYEKQNNIEIKNIGIISIYNEQEEGYFKEIECKSVITQNALKAKWSAEGIINFYTGRKLQQVDLNTEDSIEYLKYFGEEDYYICVGDTIYVKIYNY